MGIPAESPKPLSEEDLHAIETALLDLRRTIAAASSSSGEICATASTPPHQRLIIELRPAHLVKDAAPYFDGMDTDGRTRGTSARSATAGAAQSEVDRE